MTIRFDIQVQNCSVFPANTAIITLWFENNLKLPEGYNSSYHPEEFQFEDSQCVPGFKKVFDVNPTTPIFGTQGFGFTNPLDRFDTFLDIDIAQGPLKTIGPFVPLNRRHELRARIKWEIQAPYMSTRLGFKTLVIGPEYEPSTCQMLARLENGSEHLIHSEHLL